MDIDLNALARKEIPAPIKPKVGADPFSSENYKYGTNASPVRAKKKMFGPSKEKVDRFFRNFDSVVVPMGTPGTGEDSRSRPASPPPSTPQAGE